MKRIIVLLGIASVGAILFACAPEAIPKAPAGEKSSEVAAPLIKTGWEAEWEKTQKAAQKEGKVVVYAATPGPALKAAVPFFKNKLGLDLEVLTGRGSEVSNKLAAERKNSIYVADVFITGMNTHFTVSLPQGWPDPMEPLLMLPEVKNPENWFGGTLPWSDPEHRILSFLYFPNRLITVNTALVGPNDITSYYDLLDHKWKDKILIGDPQVAGSAFGNFSSLLTYVLDLDYFRKLVKQGPVLRDEKLVADWVARGKYPVAMFGTTTGSTAQYKEAGAPIGEIDVKEGTFLSVDGSGTIVLNKRPHPNATRVFINWLLSKEGQIHIQKEMRYQSARTDIGTDGVDPLTIRKPGGKYFPSTNLSLEWLKNEQDKYQKLAQEIFGGR